MRYLNRRISNRLQRQKPDNKPGKQEPKENRENRQTLFSERLERGWLLIIKSREILPNVAAYFLPAVVFGFDLMRVHIVKFLDHVEAKFLRLPAEIFVGGKVRTRGCHRKMSDRKIRIEQTRDLRNPVLHSEFLQQFAVMPAEDRRADFLPRWCALHRWGCCLAPQQPAAFACTWPCGVPAFGPRRRVPPRAARWQPAFAAGGRPDGAAARVVCTA